MSDPEINLYSDTQTRPSAAMRQCMAQAEVGDEQHGLDPTVNHLCDTVAELLGKEAAVFLPSGTMCNEIAIAVHCRAGDEIYAHNSSHIINFEGGGPSVISRASCFALDGARGIYSAATLAAAIRTPNRYAPRPRLVVVEQTANMGGGAVWPLEQIEAVTGQARGHGLALHMDGARLLNAVVASGTSAASFCAAFDSCWIDLSKGLGCPMGAVLAGTRAFVDEAWWWKQRLGGALRQAGIVAAAGIYALENNVERLADDHHNARLIAELADQAPGISIVHGPVETNLVFMDVAATGKSASQLSAELKMRGIRIGAMGAHLLRAATHLDVTREQAVHAASVLSEIAAASSGLAAGDPG